MPRDIVSRLIKKIATEKADGAKKELWRDFWTRETGTGQRVAQLLDCYMVMMMMILWRELMNRCIYMKFCTLKDHGHIYKFYLDHNFL
jgi:hypothetical protein